MYFVKMSGHIHFVFRNSGKRENIVKAVALLFVLKSNC